MITAKDIAEFSGVSRTTVFAVLKGKPGVTEKTRQKVLDTLAEHGYNSGLVPRTLVAEFSKRIGVLIGNINNPFFTEMLCGVDEVFRSEGFHHTLYYGTDRTRDSYLDGIGEYEFARSTESRGYIISSGPDVDTQGQFVKSLKGLQKAGKPLVTVMPAPGVKTHVVSFDSRHAFREATGYLAARGHRRIGIFRGPVEAANAKQRYLGYIESLVEHDIEVDQHLVFQAGETSDEGHATAMDALSDPAKRPTAVVCYNDLTAVGVYKAAHELGLRIPQDLSVVGFDGIDLGDTMGPPLTTVSIFPRRIGRAAATLLIEAINGEHRRGVVERAVKHALIERDSVAER